MRKRNLRAISLLLAGVMSLGLFAGCSKDSGKKDPGKGDGGKKDSIVIATMGETPSLSPTEHNAVAGSYMNLLTYNTLFSSDMDMRPSPIWLRAMRMWTKAPGISRSRKASSSTMATL